MCLTGMSGSQPRWCQCRVMLELSNMGSSSKCLFSMTTARAPPESPVPQICGQTHEPSSDPVILWDVWTLYLSSAGTLGALCSWH